MLLPRGVQTVQKNGRTYHYYAPGRGTALAGNRISLGTDPHAPEFWRELRKARGDVEAHRAGTFSALIAAYRASPEFGNLRDASKRDYNHFLDRLDDQAGDRLVAALETSDIYELRDGMSATPVSANYMVTVIRNLIKWGIPRKYRKDNPAIGVERLKIDDNGARPWPDDAYRFVIKNAPTTLKRVSYLGRSTGQRISDLVRMRPCDLERDGINLKIGKRRDEAHFVPLTETQMIEIRSWGVTGLDFFLKSSTGRKLSSNHLNNLWSRWRNSKAARPIRGIKLTMHGLRATAVVDRQLMGTPDNGIADELGMSVGMVRRYARFADKAEKARASRDRRERAANGIVNPATGLKTSGS